MKAFLSSWKSYAFSMTSIYSNSSWKARLFTHTTKERSKNKSGTGRQGGGGGGVRESERKEKEEVEVWEHLSCTLGLFIWGAGLGCQMWHHTQTNTLDRRVRKVSDKSRDCFSLSIKKVSDRWRRGLFVIVCVCHMHCCNSWFSPENTTRTDRDDSPHSPMLHKVTADQHDPEWPKP